MSTPPDDWPRARAVFEHALTLTSAARPLYLAAACAGNARLREHVERMVVSHERVTGFLETPVAFSPTDLDVAIRLEGTQIGPYQLGSRIGAGGMGEVYRARDTRLDRAVAIKVLPSHVADDRHARERFDREARGRVTGRVPDARSAAG